MHPKLIRQKGQSLLSLISTLGTRDSLKVRRDDANRLVSDKTRHQQPAENHARKSDHSQ